MLFFNELWIDIELMRMYAVNHWGFPSILTFDACINVYFAFQMNYCPLVSWRVKMLNVYEYIVQISFIFHKGIGWKLHYLWVCKTNNTKMAWRSPTPMKREWQSVISPSLNISVYNIWQQKKQWEKDFWNQGRCYTLLKLIMSSAWC